MGDVNSAGLAEREEDVTDTFTDGVTDDLTEDVTGGATDVTGVTDVTDGAGVFCSGEGVTAIEEDTDITDDIGLGVTGGVTRAVDAAAVVEGVAGDEEAEEEDAEEAEVAEVEEGAVAVVGAGCPARGETNCSRPGRERTRSMWA